MSKEFEATKTYVNGIGQETTEYIAAKALADAVEVRPSSMYKVARRGARALPLFNAALTIQDGYQGFEQTKDRYGDNPTIGQYATSTIDGLAHGLSFGLIPEGAVVDLGKSLFSKPLKPVTPTGSVSIEKFKQSLGW